MEEFMAGVFGFGLLGILIGVLIIILVCKLYIYLIKCGVRDALEEITFTDELENAVKIGVLQALEEFYNEKQHERPTD